MSGLNSRKNLILPGSSPLDIANEINNTFIAATRDIPALDHARLPAYLPSHSPPPTITPEEVYKKLNKIKIGKSEGPDCFPPRLIKDFAYELCFPLTNIFNCSMREGIVPDIWKMSYIVPIPKSNPPTLNNLRPISLTCVFAKIFEDFVVDWILEDIRILNDKHQFGSLKGSSTTHYLVKLLDDIQKAVDFPKHSAALITTDFSKAFDRIDHHILIEKFIHLGVRTSILPWICSLLSSRSQAVRYNGTLSNWETVKAGVPQGTKIGLIAFLVMFNDFVTDHQEVTHYKYVDDMTLSQSFKNSENAIGLQNELDCLQQWADTNNMKINPPKCQALSICFQRTPAVPPSFHIGNSAITNTSCMKILGVHLQSNLKWDTQINSMCKAFNYKLYLLRQLNGAALLLMIC